MKSILKKNGPIAHLIINRPEQLNVLNSETIASMIDNLNICQNDKNIKIILLTSSGEKAFCAGGDVKEIYYKSLKRNTLAKEYFEYEFLLNKLLIESDKLIISHIKGIVMGGGVALSMSGDFKIADETTIFALPEVNLGIFPDVGLGHYISKLERVKALYLTLLGNSYKGSEILDFGFASHFINNSSWPKIIKEIESLDFAGKNKQDLKSDINCLLNKYAVKFKPSFFEKNKDFIIKNFSKNSLEKIYNSLKNDPGKIAKETLENLRSKDPIASQIIFYKYFADKNLSREEIFKKDLNILNYCYEKGNMKEGIKSLLIRKDTPNFSSMIDIDEIKKLILNK